MSGNRLPIRSGSRQLAVRDSADTSFSRKLLIGSSISTIATFVSSIILIFIFSAIATSSKDPLSLIPLFGIISLMPSMFIGGFICIKRVKESPFICGLVCGASFVITATLLSLIIVGLPSSGYAFLQHFALRIAAVFFSVLGAIVGNVKRKSKRRRFG